MLDFSGIAVRDIKIPETFNVADEILDRNIEAGRADKVALICHGDQVTYRQLLGHSNRIGNALRALGVERENRVVLVLFDCPEAIYSMLGAMKIGAVPVPVSTMAMPDEYEYFLNDSRAKVLVVDERLLPLIDPIRGTCKYLRHVVVVGQPRQGELGYAQVTAKASPELVAAETHKDDMAFWLYSSGTTGRPKGIVHLHHDMVYASEAFYIRWHNGGPEDIVYLAAKLFFGFGTACSLFFSLWGGSTTVLVPERPTPEVLLETIHKHRVTMVGAAPTIYAAVLRMEGAETYDLSSVRVAWSAGESLPLSVYEGWKKRFGVELLEGLGSSDVELDYCQNRPGECKPGTVGRVVEGYEAKVMSEDGHEVATGEIGELWIKGDSTPPFYWNKHDLSKQTIKGEWFRTGDTVFRDEEGFIHYVGRWDDVFKSSGIWVSPAEVEGVLVSHPKVLEAGVVGLPDNAGLIKAAAFVVPAEGVEASIDLVEELQAFVREKLAAHKVPRSIKFVGKIPRTPTGKIQRYKLRQQESVY
ncbi:MAG: benzoate-CoA ligase family protein [Clostridia bacterium]|nr:MAG: benzoate-CoA ligase family protein [Clostridia bacterium]